MSLLMMLSELHVFWEMSCGSTASEESCGSVSFYTEVLKTVSEKKVSMENLVIPVGSSQGHCSGDWICGLLPITKLNTLRHSSVCFFPNFQTLY